MKRMVAAALLIVTCTAASAPRVAIGVLPAVGEHQAYRYAQEMVSGLTFTASARFEVTRTGDGAIVVSDREHAPAPVAFTITADGLRQADLPLPAAKPGPAVLKGEVYTVTVAADEAVKRRLPVAVPPPEYARLVRLTAAVADAPLGVERAVPGCTATAAWTVRLDEALDGGSRLVAHCAGADQLVLGGPSPEHVTQHLEYHLHASFDAAGRFTHAEGDTQHAMTIHDRPVTSSADWTISLDRS